MPKLSNLFFSLIVILSSWSVQAYYPDMGPDQPTATYGLPVEDKTDLCLRQSVELFNQISSRLTQKQIEILKGDLAQKENCHLKSEYLQNIKRYLDNH